MATNSLLAHLADRFVTQRENLATEALAYLLGKDVVTAAFGRHLQRFTDSQIDISRCATQYSTDADHGIPDIVGYNSDGSNVLLVEAKFAAALTVHQPTSYMRHLAEFDHPGMLLFLVPIRRLEPVWSQILQRCAAADMALEVDDARGRVGKWKNVTVAVTSWNHLLDDLSSALNPTDHGTELSEVNQLHGLCEREDQEAFAHFSTAELDGSIGQRMIDLNGLLNEAVDVLRSEGIADVRALRWSAGDGWFGRYFQLKRTIWLLHVNFRSWGRDRATPLWLRIDKPDTRVLDSLHPLTMLQPSRVLSANGGALIPIELPAGVDRDTVLERILVQMREVNDLLPEPSPHAETLDSPQIDDVSPTEA